MGRQLHRQASETREETLLRQARRHARRGDERGAMLALRECCFSARENARLWTLYGFACWRARRQKDAVDALRQALWLRQRNRDEARARVVRTLLKRIESGETPNSKRAA